MLAIAADLISQRGPHSVTIRELAAAADANIAAVNYHFGSKAKLVEEVLIAIFEPINAARMELLRDFERKAAPEPVGVRDILEALLRPIVESRTGADGGSLYLRALQHLRANPGEAPSIFVFSTFDDVAQYFIGSLQKALPALTRAEVLWRYELVRGAAIHMLGNCDPISGKFRHLSKEASMIDIDDKDAVLCELLDFSIAGMEALPSWTAADLKAPS